MVLTHCLADSCARVGWEREGGKMQKNKLPTLGQCQSPFLNKGAKLNKSREENSGRETFFPILFPARNLTGIEGGFQ